MKEIILTQGKTALVDDEDYIRLNRHYWSFRKIKYSSYAGRNVSILGEYKTLLMHRDILIVPEGMVIDHINGNGLDNRKINLRICTYSQNSLNRIHNPIIHKGVTFRKDRNKYQAKIITKNKTTHIGYFNSVEDASSAYFNYLKEH